MQRIARYVALLMPVAAMWAWGAELRPPQHVVAGTSFSIASSGSGGATFYLIGPGHVAKRQIDLGQEIAVKFNEVKTAGRYIAIACGGDGCSSVGFYVEAAQPTRISFLLHPSRVPVSARDSINATAFVFDKFHNPVLTPGTVDFRIIPKTGAPFERSVKTERGIAWIRLDSTPREGAVKVVASSGEASESRVIQQVASDACNLRIKATRGPKGVLIETDPVRDCSGNALPDGTIVSFTAIDDRGTTTVDAPIKKGVARTELQISGNTKISVASGVVTGNEISLGGRS